MKKRIFITVLSAAAIAVVLTACGKKSFDVTKTMEVSFKGSDGYGTCVLENKYDWTEEVKDWYGNDLTSQEKSDLDFMLQALVDYNIEQAWKLAELRERLKKEGKDELYVDVCLRKSAELVDEYGSEIPEHKTKEVKAYMNAWDLTRGRDFQKSSLEEKKRFIDIYVNVYMNASYPENPKAIPWDRFDDFVLDIAKRRFKGENVDVEPRTLDTLLNAMMQNKAKGNL